jgi:ketosteroid isomerase-like protein
MSRSDKAALAELWRAYSEGRLARALELLDPECEITMVDGENTYTGRDGVLRWLEEVRQGFKTLTVSYEEVDEPHEGCLVAAGRIAATPVDNGRTIEGRLVCVAEFHEGRLRRARAFVDRDEALRYAAGLRNAHH